MTGERQIRKDVKQVVPGSDAEFITGKTGRESGPTVKKQASQLTFDAFNKQVPPKNQVPQFTVQKELSGNIIPQTDQEYVRKHTAELRDMQKSYRDRINNYQVTPLDPELKMHNVFLALEKHHLDQRTTQANYAALIRRAKESFAQGTHKELVEELLKKGVLKQTIW